VRVRRGHRLGGREDRGQVLALLYSDGRSLDFPDGVGARAQDAEVSWSDRRGVGGRARAVAVVFGGGSERVGRWSGVRRLSRALLLA
jgi:hypothetical protein